MTFTCTLCEEKDVRVVEALGHTYENGVCTVCGAEEPGKEPEEPQDMTEESLQAAIDAAEAGSTVTLTGNVALTGTINITKSLVLDLNGFSLNGSSVDQLILIKSTSGEAVDVTIQNGTLDGGKSEGRGDEYVRGGAIYSTAGLSSTLTLKNCTFTNNAAGIGSALWTDRSLYMENCTVDSNVGAPGTNYSSAVAVVGPTTSEGADAPKVPSVTITGCTFEDNGRDDPSALGGALYMLGVDKAQVSDSFFTNNQGGTGGAVYCSNSNSSTYTNVEFTGVSGSGGGGVYTDNTKNLSFDGCTFTNNTAGGMGGAISHQSGPAVIADSTFTGNSATVMGGAILVADTFTMDTTLELKNCAIEDSTGGYGGAVYANQSTLTVTGAITGNAVALTSEGKNGFGGGIASLYGTLTIAEGAAVYNNTAVGVGDDIYSMGMEGYPDVLTLPAAGKMSGDLTLTGGEKITGWYVDGLKAAHGEPYSPSYMYYHVTVNYLDKDNGRSIASSYTSPSHIEGSSYDVSAYDAIAIDGYTYDSTSGDALTGVLNGNKVVNVYYVADEETDIDDGETPTTDLPDNPDPTDPGEGGETEIPDEGTPTTDLPDEPGTETEIPGCEFPLGNLPQTGTTSNAALFQAISGVFLCLAVVFGGVTVVLFRKERNQG